VKVTRARKPAAELPAAAPLGREAAARPPGHRDQARLLAAIWITEGDAEDPTEAPEHLGLVSQVALEQHGVWWWSRLRRGGARSREAGPGGRPTPPGCCRVQFLVAEGSVRGPACGRHPFTSGKPWANQRDNSRKSDEGGFPEHLYLGHAGTWRFPARPAAPWSRSSRHRWCPAARTAPGAGLRNSLPGPRRRPGGRGRRSGGAGP
jgi:hypothetical protein